MKILIVGISIGFIFLSAFLGRGLARRRYTMFSNLFQQEAETFARARTYTQALGWLRDIEILRTLKTGKRNNQVMMRFTFEYTTQQGQPLTAYCDRVRDYSVRGTPQILPSGARIYRHPRLSGEWTGRHQRYNGPYRVGEQYFIRYNPANPMEIVMDVNANAAKGGAARYYHPQDFPYNMYGSDY